MELPFQVGQNHGVAMQKLHSDMEFYNFMPTNNPTWFGFIVMDVDGKYRYADRKESYAVATEADQLNGREGLPSRLDSYQIGSFDQSALLDLECLALDVNEKFKNAVFEVQLAPLDNR